MNSQKSFSCILTKQTLFNLWLCVHSNTQKFWLYYLRMFKTKPLCNNWVFTRISSNLGYGACSENFYRLHNIETEFTGKFPNINRIDVWCSIEIRSNIASIWKQPLVSIYANPPATLKITWWCTVPWQAPVSTGLSAACEPTMPGTHEHKHMHTHAHIHANTPTQWLLNTHCGCQGNWQNMNNAVREVASYINGLPFNWCINRTWYTG